MRLSRSVDYAAALLSTNIKAAVALRGAFWLQACFMLLNNVIYAAVWWIFFEKFKSINGWQAGDTFLLYGLVAASFGASVVFAGGARDLARAIVEGSIDTYLTQPKSPLLQIVFSKTQAAGWGDMFSGVVLMTASGKIHAAQIPVLLACILCGAVIFTVSNVTVQCAAFWAGPIDSLARQFTEFLITFSIYPERIFGGWLRFILFTALPAGFLGYVPVQLLAEFSWPQLGLLAAATTGYVLLALYIFNTGLRRYESGNQIVLGNGA